MNKFTNELRSGLSTKRLRPVGVLFESPQRHDDESISRRPRTLSVWIKTQLAPLGSLRDEILVTASVLYVTGYAVWSFNSWRNNLGLLPALDPQYFIAGLLPVLIVVIAYLIGWLLRRFLLDVWPNLVHENAKGVWRVIRHILLYAFALAFGLFLLGPIPTSIGFVVYVLFRIFAPNYWSKATSQNAKPNYGLAVMILIFLALFIFAIIKRDYLNSLLGINTDIANTVAGLVFTVAVTLLPPIEDSIFSLISKAYRWFWVYFAPFVFIVGGLNFYLQRVYPNVPQAFGGVLPRCATLDVVKAQVSSDTLRYLLPEGAPNDEPIAHSKQLEVLYSGSNVLLVRSRGKVLEINKGIIQSMHTCD